MSTDGPGGPAAAGAPEPTPEDQPTLGWAAPPPQPVPPLAYPVTPPAPRRGWDGVSIAALILAVPGAVVAAIPLAIAGLTRTRNGVRRGRPLAVAGLALSWVWTVVIALAVGAAAALLVQDPADPDAASVAEAAEPVVTSSATPAASGSPGPSPAVSGVPAVRPRKIRIGKVRPGHCIDKEPTEEFLTLPVVPCAQPHDVEVFAVRGLGSGRWPGDDGVNDRSEAECIEAFQAYVGIPYDESTLEIGWYSPSAAGWRVGDRTAVCVLEDPAARLVGTMRNSQR